MDTQTYLTYKRDSKPRIRCLNRIYLIYKNKAQARNNIEEKQSKSFELACDMALALK